MNELEQKALETKKSLLEKKLTKKELITPELLAKEIEEEASETKEEDKVLLEKGLSSLLVTDQETLGKGKTIFESISAQISALKEKYFTKIKNVSENTNNKPPIETGKMVKVREKDGTIKTYDISSPEYRAIYDSGDLISYDPENNVVVMAKPLDEVIATASKPEWAKSKEKYEKEFTKDWYIDNKMPAWSRRAGVDDTNMHPNNVKSWEQFINNKVAEDIFKGRPNFDKEYDKDRLKTLQGFSQKELEIIKNSDYAHKIEPSIWQKFEQGLLSVANMGPVEFKNENLTQEEAKQESTPLNILQPLSVPAKMVQSAYKENYTLKDAIKGKQNNAGFLEDVVTDPLNLVGIGLWSKLSKVGKFAKIEDAYQVVNGLSKEEAILKLETIAKESDIAKGSITSMENSVDDLNKVTQTIDEENKIAQNMEGQSELPENINDKSLTEEVKELRKDMKEREMNNKKSTKEIKTENSYTTPDEFYSTLKPDMTPEQASEFLKNYNGSIEGDLSVLGHNSLGAVSNNESTLRTAYLLKNKIRMPEAPYLYHGTTMKNFEKISSSGLDNSLGTIKNPGAMSENLGEGITTATGDIESAKRFSQSSVNEQPVLLRFKPALQEKPTLSYTGAHPKVNPKDIEYSLDDGKTWQRKTQETSAINTLEEIAVWEKLDNHAFNPEGFYRIVNEEGYQDYLKEGVLRPAPEGTPTSMSDNGRFDLGHRTTGFPSFSKGTPDLSYAKQGEVNYIIESNIPLYGRGDKNPKTDKVITSFRHWAYRPIDPETGDVIKAMTPDMIKHIYKLSKDGNLYIKK